MPDLVSCCAVAVDGSDSSMEAVAWACRLTQPNGRIIMVDIQDLTPLYAEMGMTPFSGGPNIDVDQISEDWDRDAQSVKEAAMAMVTQAGRVGEWHVRTMEPGDGSPAALFAKVAAEHQAELILVGQHHGSTRIEGLFGSFPRWLVAHSHLPVLIVPIPAHASP
ncbi:universal stress protein [Sulfobacillus sp. hq2]|uniref:universal stress protein n=1 Tax=Sulfobacillus TaxID=28033 RepID=UPI000CD06135|nr:universal stress protein [Sulfobacillus sp. hq2]POB09878.1 hypothetical protein CO251_13350 [Sulfobacillus sp. hq2]